MTALLALDAVTLDRGGRRVLDAASLALAPGQRLALVGANGAGKTTLLRTLIGLETPASGRVLAFGEPRRGEAAFAPVRRRVGLLFQDPDDQLFCPTVLEDVAFGPLNLGRPRADAFADAAATLAGLGLSALSGRLTHRLSGGEKRLVALAGLLAMRPDALLLDEPTVALDAPNRARMLDLLARLPAAMVIVSHDREALARLSTRAVVLRDGRIGPASIHVHATATPRPHIHGLDDDHGHQPGEGASRLSAPDPSAPVPSGPISA
jgi:cobalt/nickel transport system ATP-binding protein